MDGKGDMSWEMDTGNVLCESDGKGDMSLEMDTGNVLCESDDVLLEINGIGEFNKMSETFSFFSTGISS